MNSHTYKRVMDNVKFDAKFEKRVIDVLQGAVQKHHRHAWRFVCAGIGIAACILGAVAVLTMMPLQNASSQVAVQTPAVIAEVTNSVQDTAPSVTVKRREVVKSSDYGYDLASYMAPEPGQVIITEPVRRAMEDGNNDNALYFVSISILTPEQVANWPGDYVYNGRSIKEWNEMVDLSNEKYPYNEYNGDHGGHVTIEQWKQVQEEAKNINAQETRDAAIAEYEKNVKPMLGEAQNRWESAEIERLSQLGYDVFMYDSWTYADEGKKKPQQVLTAILTKEQLVHFDADANCGYLIDWVHNGDGIVNWEMCSQ